MANKKNILSLARGLKAVAFDVDGVLTSGSEYISSNGEVFKVRCYADGQGVSLLRALGLKIVFITSESGKSSSSEFIKKLVKKWNGLPSSCRPDNPSGWATVSLYTGDDPKKNKGDILLDWLSLVKIKPEDCAVMGDDLVDVPMLKLAGLKIAPAQAEEVIRGMVDWVTERPGGSGAVRDLANLVLKARDVDPLDLSPN